MHGWVPGIIQAVAVTVLLVAIGWRSPRWRTVWLPLSILVGVATAAWARWYLDSQGLAGDPAPRSLSIWVGLTGVAVGVVILGWRRGRWWRRGVSIAAVPLCLLCAALALNQWVGYFPTVQTAWNQLTAGPLPDETDAATVVAMRQSGTIPETGKVVQVDIDDAQSHFKHRRELVYLPPAWFATNPALRLPTVMMIGGEFNTPADWLRAGNAVKTIDEFAAAHKGNAPVFVFVDSGGAFNNDTECVNGNRGNAADHLTKDVIPFMVSQYGVSSNPANWAVVGWSMGGTCAVDLTVMHPELFSTFEDIAGDLTPNSGTKAQTVARLFNGNPDAWAQFDPSTVIKRHGPYTGVAGWFAVNGAQQQPRMRLVANPGSARSNSQTVAANTLCGLSSAHSISCAVVTQTGKHDWPFAARAFASALPWLAGQIGTPGVPRIPFPPSAPPPPSPSRQLQAARK
ncbi:MAG TPA: alpha/beta hydrolase-fold protein [Mycobacterium sp.]|nr:alpha/beta hydrolase-fold protein [Mycobacterium sp.]